MLIIGQGVPYGVSGGNCPTSLDNTRPEFPRVEGSIDWVTNWLNLRLFPSLPDRFELI